MSKRKLEEEEAASQSGLSTSVAGYVPSPSSGFHTGVGMFQGKSPLVFNLEATCGRARAATVTLPHGDVLTPATCHAFSLSPGRCESSFFH